MNPRGRSRGLPFLVGALAALVVIATMPMGVARADVAFRKKKAAPTDSSGAEAAAPTGGEVEGGAATEGGDAPAAPPPKTEYVPQAEDKDRPRDRELEKQQADAMLLAKQQQEAEKNKPPAWYTKWQAWALIGGGLVVLGAIGYGAFKLDHNINGGDVRMCNPDFTSCFGAGH
jgi:hypothetical protein